MSLKEMSNEELLFNYSLNKEAYHEFGEQQDFQNSQDIKAELLSRLEAGQKAIAAMKQMDILWQSNLTQDEFDKQLVVILLKYKEGKVMKDISLNLMKNKNTMESVNRARQEMRTQTLSQTITWDYTFLMQNCKIYPFGLSPAQLEYEK